MNENPAGAVTLELIIEDTAQKQIESIARRAAKPAEAAFQKVGASIEKAMTPNTKNVQKAVQDVWNKAAKQAQKNPSRFEVAASDTDLLQQNGCALRKSNLASRTIRIRTTFVRWTRK